MNEVVLDASVVLKWFHTEGEPHVEDARKLRAHFEAGRFNVMVPSLLWLEVLNVAARRLRWAQQRLEQLAATLGGLGFIVVEPDLARVARWAADGLTAYDAAYVAVAEQTGTELITDDARLVSQVPQIAVALAAQTSQQQEEDDHAAEDQPGK